MTYSINIDLPPLETYALAMRTAYSYRRISTPEQRKGSGLRRQIESAIKYCQEHKLRLDDTLKLSDEGVSAFKGDNVLRGKLGEFLRLVEKGKVKKGSVLLVESIDRLSRQNVLDAQELFLSIINRGITIVTLMDGQDYSREEIQKNPWKLMISLSVMIRANEESETKSKRIRSSRLKRNKEAEDGKPFRVWTPPWCSFKDGQYAVNEEKASIIRRVFDEYLDGKGPMAIAATLNEEGISYFGRTETEWYKKVVADLLRDKRLIGHAHWLDKDDYFPRVIEPDLFNRVQFRLKERTNKGGQTGLGIVNIFAGSMRCGHCGGNVCKSRAVNAEGYEYYYLVCENARTGKKSCPYRSIMYDAVEESFLYLMRFRPWFQQKLTDDDGGATDARIETLKGNVIATEQLIHKYNNLIRDEPNPPKVIVATLSELETKVENLKKAIAIEEGKKAEKIAPGLAQEFFEDLEERMKDRDFAIKVKSIIHAMVKEIVLYVHGTKYPHYIIERTNGHIWSVVFRNPRRKQRSFQIFDQRFTHPDDDNDFAIASVNGDSPVQPTKVRDSKNRRKR